MVDSTGQTGSRTINILDPKISPSAFTNCAGSEMVFTLGDAELAGNVTWWPYGGSVSADTRTYTILLPAGIHTITANWQGCESRATGVVVAVTSLTAEPTDACRYGQVIYTAATSPPGYEHLVNWGDGVGARRTNNYYFPGTYHRSAWCANSVLSVTSRVHGISIVPSARSALANAVNPATFYQTNGYGAASWQVQGGGPSISGGSSGESVSVNPGPNAGSFNIIANPSVLPGCYSTAKLDVVKVTFSSNLLSVCSPGGAAVSFSVAPSNMLGSLAFDMASDSSPTGSPIPGFAVPWSGGTNLTVSTSVSGSARIRVKLGDSVFLGPAVHSVQMGFPADTWYLKEGASKSYLVAVTPSGAPVAYTSTNEAVAVAAGSGGVVNILGVAPGVTEIQARTLDGVLCATKQLTVVRATLNPEDLELCVGQTGVLHLNTVPPGIPVTVQGDGGSQFSITQNGTNVYVTPNQPASVVVRAMMGDQTLDTALVCGFSVSFPTNAFFAPVGRTNYLEPVVVPPSFVWSLNYQIANSNAAMITADSTPYKIGVAGVGNGTTTLTAMQGTNATCASKDVNTVFNISLASSKHNISAQSSWPGQSGCLSLADSQCDVWVNLDQPGLDPSLPVQLQVDRAVSSVNTNYFPASLGTLAPVPGVPRRWTYTSWQESSTYLWPAETWVYFRVTMNGQDLGTNSFYIRVQPVFDWLARFKKQKPCAYDFVRWKYASVLATTGGAFVGPVSFIPNFDIDCDGVAACGCTSPDGRVELSECAFQSENACAATIGHELIHTPLGGNGSECVAYTWQFNTRNQTGISSAYNRSFLTAIVVGGINKYCQ